MDYSYIINPTDGLPFIILLTHPPLHHDYHGLMLAQSHLIFLPLLELQFQQLLSHLHAYARKRDGRTQKEMCFCPGSEQGISFPRESKEFTVCGFQRTLRIFDKLCIDKVLFL